MKKKNFKLCISIITIGLFLFLLIIANSFVGNPLSKMVTDKAINAHIAENYGGLNLVLTDTKYNFKFSQYFAHAQSPTSADTHFTVYYEKGEITDDYEGYVLESFNTILRLKEEYSKVVVPIIKENMPYEFDMILATLSKSTTGDKAELSLDMDFDLENIPLEKSVTIYPYSEDFSWENVAKIALELDALMQKNNLTVDQYSVILRRNSEDTEKNYDSMGVYDFDRNLLTSEKLPQMMAAHSQAMDAEK